MRREPELEREDLQGKESKDSIGRGIMCVYELLTQDFELYSKSMAKL